MEGTLYQNLARPEEINEMISERNKDIKIVFEDSPELLQQIPDLSASLLSSEDIQRYQFNVMESYKQNPILKDAILGKNSVEDSLIELREVNRGLKKYLPRRRDKAHNKRVYEMSELIGGGYGLTKRGRLYPDNYVAGFAIASGLCCGISAWIFPQVLEAIRDGPDAEEARNAVKSMQITFPIVGSAIIGPISGVLFQQFRNLDFSTENAQFIDQKVEEFYR